MYVITEYDGQNDNVIAVVNDNETDVYMQHQYKAMEERLRETMGRIAYEYQVITPMYRYNHHKQGVFGVKTEYRFVGENRILIREEKVTYTHIDFWKVPEPIKIEAAQ